MSIEEMISDQYAGEAVQSAQPTINECYCCKLQKSTPIRVDKLDANICLDCIASVMDELRAKQEELKLERVTDAFADDIDAMSDAQILQEAKDDGIDTVKLAAEFRSSVFSMIAQEKPIGGPEFWAKRIEENHQAHANISCELANQRRIDALQYKIDTLMLEYCPDEMTTDQKLDWANHQRPASNSDIGIPTLESLQQPAQEEPSRMTQKKTDILKSQGHKVIGHVLRMGEDGVTISAEEAVRWIKNVEYWDLMHPKQQQAQSTMLRKPTIITPDEREMMKVEPYFANDGAERDWSELEAQQAQPDIAALQAENEAIRVQVVESAMTEYFNENLTVEVADLKQQVADMQKTTDSDAFDLAVGRQMLRASKELPFGFDITIYIERDAGTVTMTDDDGNEFSEFDGEEFPGKISMAIDMAIEMKASK